jgi:hypothetical protein
MKMHHDFYIFLGMLSRNEFEKNGSDLVGGIRDTFCIDPNTSPYSTRLTLAFSKKRENFEAAVALHFAYYNFVKCHNTIRCTPAMAAGVERDFWSVGDLVEAAS